MALAIKCLVVFLALVSPCEGLLAMSGQSQRLSVNPIRRVVNLLQQMQKKVEAEGEKEKKLFEKFLCYCKTGRGSLETSVESAKGANEQLIASIEETDAALKQTKADLKTAQTSRADAEKTLAKAKGLREKGAAAFAKTSGEMKTNIASIHKATEALEKGLYGSFLQTSGASVLKQLSITMDISSVDREMLTSFLAQKQGEDADDNAPQTMEITGIIKQMGETMEKDLATATNEEEEAIRDFEELQAAKTKEAKVLTKQIETKTARIGELGVQLITQKEDLDDTSKSLMEDQVFLQDLDKNCKTKADEWDEIEKLRADELVSLADTIKILNDDDALDLFKKTLPNPSLLQLTTTSKAVKDRALMFLQRSRHGHKHRNDFRLNLISLALKGKKVSFDKVIAQVDMMMGLLKKEQQDDNDKNEYCKLLIDKQEDEIKGLEISVKDHEKAIASGKEAISALADEIQALTEGINTLDKQVSDATSQRKEEHADSVEVLTSDNAAKELLGIAKNRLNKFYNPKMYKAPPKRELSEADRITVNMGGTLAPTAAPGGIAGTGVTAFSQEELSFTQVSRSRRSASKEAPPPPPDTAKAYRKKGEESNGVIAMLDMMIGGLDKEIQATKHDEKEGQREYEEFMKDSAEKRANDAKSISDKEAAKTDLEATLLKETEDKTKTQKEAQMKHKFLQEVHSDCDWLLLNYDTRKEARNGELDALSKSKDVLSGADYSLLQSSSVHHALRR